MEETNKVCPMCLLQVPIALCHHLQTACSSKGSIKRMGKKAFEYEGKIFVCLCCFMKLNFEEWRQHSRHKSRKSTSSKSRKSYSSDFQNDTLKSESRISFVSPNKWEDKSKITQATGLSNIFLPVESQTKTYLQYMLVTLSIYLDSWIKENSYQRNTFLFTVYRRYVDEIINKLKQLIPKIKWEDLYASKLKLQWTNFLKYPEEIFDIDYIKGQVTALSSRQQNKLFTFLNQQLKKYPNVFGAYPHTKKQLPLKPRNKNPLLPQEFIEVIFQLFRTKLKDCIHLGLDLMIIYQSGQRFPSDIEEVTKGIKKLLQEEDKTVFEIKSAKTKKISTVVLNNQLVLLLKAFKWRNFWSVRLISRLSAIFPFTSYSLRRGYICFLYLGTNKEKTEALSLLTQHTTGKNVDYYVQSVLRKQLQILKNKLIIPHLAIEYQTKEKVLLNIPDSSIFTERVLLPQGWFTSVYHKLKKNGLSQVQDNYLQEQFDFQEPRQQIQNLPTNKEQDKYQQSNSSSEQVEVENIVINSYSVQRKYGKFDVQDIMLRASTGKCFICQGDIDDNGKECRFCWNRVHKGCMQGHFCDCMIINNKKECIKVQGANRKCELQLQMPEEYVKQHHPQIDQIRFLTHLRGLYYTNIAVLDESIKLEVVQQLLEKQYFELILPSYDSYVNYKYFPSLELKLTHILNPQDAQFGLFAAKDINKSIFIGEYAADIFFNSKSLLVKRHNMIMSLVMNNPPSKGLSIGPLKYCGYICLINHSDQNPNCSSQTVVINGALKIVVFSNRYILKGEQISYNYSFLGQSENINDLNPQNDSKVQQTLKCGIKNVKNNCYINCILQIFKRFKHKFQIPQEQMQVNQIMRQLSQFYKCQTIFDPTSLIQNLMKMRSNLFKLNQQEDAHQLLICFLNEFSSFLPLEFMSVTYNIEIECLSCLNISRKQQKAYQIMVSMQQKLQKMNQERVQKISDYLCLSCSHNQATIKRKIYSTGELLFVTILRFEGIKKANKKKEFPSMMLINNQRYDQVMIILHKGKNAGRGHYTAVLLREMQELDDQQIHEVKSIDARQTYIAVYERLSS